MPPDYIRLRSHYNTRFARAVVQAHVLGKKTFKFRGLSYTTEYHVSNVANDISNGHYKIAVIELRRH